MNNLKEFISIRARALIMRFWKGLVIKIYQWRITKYNPENRDKNDVYKKNEWTSVSDIGKKFENNEFTFEKYLFYENAYIGAIINIIRENNVEMFKIDTLEKYEYINYNDFSELESKKYFKSLRKDMLIPKQKIKQVAQFALRNIIWCRLVSEEMFIHFGYDYYMYIGSTRLSEETLKKIKNNQLFVEERISPYI